MRRSILMLSEQDKLASTIDVEFLGVGVPPTEFVAQSSITFMQSVGHGQTVEMNGLTYMASYDLYVSTRYAFDLQW